MRQGIQTNYPDERLKKWGCYFFALMQWAERITGQNQQDYAVNLMREAERLALISPEIDILKPVDLLNFFIGGYPSIRFTSCEFRKEPPDNQIRYIVCLKKPNYMHFVLSDEGEIWDALDPARPSAKDYRPDSYRVFL